MIPSAKYIADILHNLFSEHGISINALKIISNSPLKLEINNASNGTCIIFKDEKPKIEIKKFITFYVYVEQINFGVNGGSIKLKNFPDFYFSYEDEDAKFGNINIKEHDFCEIDKEIKQRYNDAQKQKIASLCLQYCKEWVTISSRAGVSFNNADIIDRYVLKEQCAAFVTNNVLKDIKSNRHSSVVGSWILIYVVIPMMIKWIVNKILSKVFEKEIV